MRKYRFLVFVLALTIGISNVVAENFPPGLSVQEFKQPFAGTKVNKYCLFFPENYGKTDERWPLILYLHGAGARSNDINRLKNSSGLLFLIRSKPDFPFVVVAPLCPPDEWWFPDTVKSCLDEALARFSLDPQRIYLTGVSMGGYGTWYAASKYPNRFAAIVPIAGGGNYFNIFTPKELGLENTLITDINNSADFLNLRDIPTWVFHGAEDNLVPVNEAANMVSNLEEMGGNVKLTLYPDIGHDPEETTYNSPKIFEWFLMHRIEQHNSTIIRKKNATPLSGNSAAGEFLLRWSLEETFAGAARVTVGPQISTTLQLLRKNPSPGQLHEKLTWHIPDGSAWKISPLSAEIDLPAGGEAQTAFAVSFRGSLPNLYPLPRLESIVLKEGQVFARSSAPLPVNARAYFLSEGAPVARCRPFKTAPTIDGNLDDPAWSDSTALSGFLHPYGDRPAEHPTEVRSGYDNENLYFSFLCREPDPATLVTSIKEHDGKVWQDDSIDIFLDMKLDRETYCQLVVNADGVTFDGKKGGEPWEAKARVAAGRRKDAWTLEIAIPWESLGIQTPEQASKFGFESARFRPQRTNEAREKSQWAPTFNETNHQPKRFGTLILDLTTERGITGRPPRGTSP